MIQLSDGILNLGHGSSPASPDLFKDHNSRIAVFRVVTVDVVSSLGQLIQVNGLGSVHQPLKLLIQLTDQHIQMFVSLPHPSMVLEPLSAFSDQLLLGLFDICSEFVLVSFVYQSKGGQL